MPAGTSLGHGIGLQTPRGLPDYWLRRFATENRQDELAEQRKAEKEQEELVKLTDIELDYDSYLPPYGKAIAAEYSTMLNNIARYKQQNNGKLTPGMIREEALKARQKIGAYEMSNKLAKDYVEKQGFLKDDKLRDAFLSTESTVYDLPKYNRGKYIQIGPNGEFSYLPVKDEAFTAKYDKTADMVETLTGGKERVGGFEFVDVKYDTSPESVERETLRLMNNAAFRDQVIFNSGTELMQQPNEKDDDWRFRVSKYVEGEARKIAERDRYPSRTEKVKRVIPQGGSGGASKEKFTAPLQEGVTVKIRTNKRMVEGTDVDGNPIMEEAFDEVEAKRPLYQAVKVPNPITIGANSRMLDASTNEPIKGTFQFNFKPDGVTAIAIKQPDGSIKWERYTQGKVVKEVGTGTEDVPLSYYMDKDKAQKNETTYTVLVPLDDTGVRSTIEATNDISKYDSKFSNLRKPVEVGKKSQGKAKSSPPVINTQEEYDALPKGTVYIDSEGNQATKR